MCLPNPLKQAADRAASEALGAQRLLTLLVPRLNSETYAEALGFCEQLKQEADAAQVAYTTGDEPATREQKEELIRLSNHQFATRTEKSEIQYGLHQLTQQQATDRLRVYNKIMDSRYPTKYAVVGSAQVVKPLAAAA
jgi:hypothetical protein